MRLGTRSATWVSKTENFPEKALVYILSQRDDELIKLQTAGIAQTLNTDRFQLTEDFRKYQNQSITSFIEREIIHRALFKLERDIDITIDELSNRFGFSTTEDFEITFKKYILVKPSRYKELVKLRANHFYQKDLLHCHCSFL